MIPRTIIHLLSGGLDSVTMLYDLHGKGEHVHCLLVDYKQQHVQELEFAKHHCQRLGVLWTRIDLPPLGGLTQKDKWIVPNRNAILLSHAVNLAVNARADTVTIGCNAEDADNFPDCRPGFIRAMNDWIRAVGYNVEICTPYIDWPKWKIAGLAREMGVDTNMIWSCYKGGKEPCGVCPACVKLIHALNV